MRYPQHAALGHRRAARVALAVALLTLLTFGSTAALAQETAFGDGSRVGGDAYPLTASPYAITYDDAVYEYATAKEGAGYYAVYADGEWSDWAGWKDQPVEYRWQPVAANLADKSYVFYSGTDNGIYSNAYDGTDWDGWTDLSGDYEFDQNYGPYVDVYEDSLYLYGVATDSTLYHKPYDAGSWGEWAEVNDDYKAGEYAPYAVAWGGYENVFWTGADGLIFWNRYDGSAWTGAKALPSAGDEYAYASAPYALGYSKDEKLYAYAIAADGAPHWNAFTEGEGWSGWQPYDAELPAKATYQPSAYEYDDIQHLVVTGEDGHAYYTTFDGASGEWSDLGDNYASDPWLYAYDDALYLTYRGADDQVYSKTYGGEKKDDDY